MQQSISRRRNRQIYLVLMFCCLLGFWLFENFYTPDPYGAEHGESSTEIPIFLLPSSTTGTVVGHQHYTLSYNEPYEQAEWVAYVLKKDHLTTQTRKRPYFMEDPKIKTKSADWRNYKGSGYDRGHLCPAGDRRFSEQAYNETFYTSNIVPQDKDFNAGVWNRLEMQVRQWARTYGDIYVITGGVLQKGLDTIGEEDVAVPHYFYKIVARGDAKSMKMIAFLLEGKENNAPLRSYAVSVDQIEEMTEIDFFQDLPDDVEAKWEKAVQLEGWRF